MKRNANEPRAAQEMEKKMKNSCCREEILFQIKKHRTSIRDCNQEASEEGKKAPKTGRKILNFDHDRGC
jgi:hypothetical protein